MTRSTVSLEALQPTSTTPLRAKMENTKLVGIPPRQSTPKNRAVRKSAKKEKKSQFPDLVEPLSIWAKNNNVQPKDVHGFATRDIKKRISQAVKNGYVKRNLNVFFLYKRAFGNVAQAWMEIHHPALAKTQPPLVTLVGESWAKESPQFKHSYTKYSELEKEGLRKAFPHYKYKPGAKKGPVGPSSSTKSSQDTGAEGIHGRKQQGGSAENCDRSKDTYSRSSTTDLYHDHGAIRGQINGNWQMNEGLGVGAQPFLPPQELPYGPRSWSDSPDQGVLMGAYSNTMLHPSHVGWQPPFRARITRSASPSFSQQSRQRMDMIPIDPSLPGTCSDYFPSRAASEEPGYIIPSQTFISGPPETTYSRAMSTGRFSEESNELANPGSGWQGYPPISRAVSEEPWHGAPDSILSSVPFDNGSGNSIPGPDSHEWHLESIEQDEYLQQFPWDLNDWTHDLDDEALDGVH